MAAAAIRGQINVLIATMFNTVRPPPSSHQRPIYTPNRGLELPSIAVLDRFWPGWLADLTFALAYVMDLGSGGRRFLAAAEDAGAGQRNPGPRR